MHTAWNAAAGRLAPPSSIPSSPPYHHFCGSPTPRPFPRYLQHPPHHLQFHRDGALLAFASSCLNASTNRCFQGRTETVARSFAALIAPHHPRLAFTQMWACVASFNVSPKYELYFHVSLCLYVCTCWETVQVDDKGRRIPSLSSI